MVDHVTVEEFTERGKTGVLMKLKSNIFQFYRKRQKKTVAYFFLFVDIAAVVFKTKFHCVTLAVP